MSRIKEIDPYRLLFPIGFAMALIGTALWISFYSGNYLLYPLTLHASTMMSGFQFCIAAGFLMTAIPRFTGTPHASATENLIALGFALLLLFSTVAITTRPQLMGAFFWLAFGFSVFLSYYFLKRFLNRSYSPPPAFSFVGLALVFSLFGNLALAMPDVLPVGVVHFGRLVLYHGMILSLVLGVGSRLITANLGWMQNPIIQISLQTRKTRRGSLSALWSSYGVSWLWSALFVLSFIIESFEVSESFLSLGNLGRILRALITSIIAFGTWKIHRMPRTQTRMSRWLWISAWSVLIGLWIYALIPTLAIAGAHIMFIGGFSMMIFMIASRVTLSHGGYDTSYEMRSPVYALIGLFALGAALIRFLSGLVPTYVAELTISASVLFLISIGIWAYAFLRKVIHLKSE